MPVKLRGPSAGTGPSAAAPPAAAALQRRLSQRTVLKALAAVGLAGLGQALAAPRAEATYINGPPDTVNTALEVQGNLKVTNSGNVGIGTTTPTLAKLVI